MSRQMFQNLNYVCIIKKPLTAGGQFISVILRSRRYLLKLKGSLRTLTANNIRVYYSETKCNIEKFMYIAISGNFKGS